MFKHGTGRLASLQANTRDFASLGYNCTRTFKTYGASYGIYSMRKRPNSCGPLVIDELKIVRNSVAVANESFVLHQGTMVSYLMSISNSCRYY